MQNNDQQHCQKLFWNEELNSLVLRSAHSQYFIRCIRNANVTLIASQNKVIINITNHAAKPLTLGKRGNKIDCLKSYLKETRLKSAEISGILSDYGLSQNVSCYYVLFIYYKLQYLYLWLIFNVDNGFFCKCFISLVLWFVCYTWTS